MVALRAVGWTDEQVFSAVSVASFFNYINRMADALGVDLEPEMRGRTPYPPWAPSGGVLSPGRAGTD